MEAWRGLDFGGYSISSILENPKPVGTPGEGLLGRIRIKILTSDGNYCGIDIFVLLELVIWRPSYKGSLIIYGLGGREIKETPMNRLIASFF